MSNQSNKPIRDPELQVLAAMFNGLEDKVDGMRHQLDTMANKTVSKEWLELIVTGLKEELTRKADKEKLESLENEVKSLKRFLTGMGMSLFALAAQTLFELFKG